MAKSTKKRVTFESCDKAFMENTFGLRRVKSLPELSDWIKSGIAATEEEKKFLQKLLSFSDFRIEDWNEEGLKINFIAPILFLVQFNGERHTAFADEKLEAEVGEYLLTGKLDWFVAKGFYKPEVPILFLQEYKRGKGNPSDPDGQILAEMVASRTLNNTPKEAMYGVVILGKYWSFIVLKENKYAISPAFDSSSEEELLSLFGILKASKKVIEQKMATL
jgi:hypothetical protein